MTESLTVGGLARLAGVTVRTLHHYDEIGLVVPSGRTDNQYRTYGQGEIERLQEVLFLRELGFALDEIKSIVGRPGYNRAEALARQRELLEAKAERLLVMVDAVDRAAQMERIGTRMSSEEMFEVFGGFDPTEYEAEAKERWGETDAYKQSAQRTSRYGKEDWARIGREADGINQRFLTLMAAGTPAEDEAAMDVAEAHRQHISKWFYDCPKPAHAGLGQLYVADQRFQDNIDKAGVGLARYMSAAIVANSSR
jgi:DNA-binding transcriptional MerR regulator